MVSLPTSSSPRSQSSTTTSRRRPEPGWGIPFRCNCGNYAVLKTSRTTLNPGRRFYGCENSEDGGFHLFKWWDDAMMEEFQGLRLAVEEISYSNMGKAPRSFSNVPTNPTTIDTLKSSISTMESEIADLKNKLGVVEKKSSGVEMRVAMVAAGLIVVVGLIIYFP